MLITKANLSVALAAPKPKVDSGYVLEYIQINPEARTVTSTNGSVIHESKLQNTLTTEDIVKDPAPLYLKAAKATAMMKKIPAKEPGFYTTFNKTRNITTMASTPMETDLAWPDIERVKRPLGIVNPIEAVVSLEALELLIDTFDKHHVDHITLRVRGREKPIVVKSQEDEGYTLTAYLMPCKLE